MRTLLDRSMIDRNIFGEVVVQTLSRMREDRISKVTIINAILDLVEVPFGHHSLRTDTSTPHSSQATEAPSTQQPMEISAPLGVPVSSVFPFMYIIFYAVVWGYTFYILSTLSL